VADSVIKQPPRSKSKNYFNQKCAEFIELRNDARFQTIQYPTQKRRKKAHKVKRQEKK